MRCHRLTTVAPQPWCPAGNVAPSPLNAVQAQKAQLEARNGRS